MGIWNKNAPRLPGQGKKRIKAPVVMQMEALECGAACLAMVLAYYRKWISLEQVRYDCGVSRDGSNALNVLKAARAYGMVAKGYRHSLDDLKEKASYPCILHWNFNHFVVLCGFKGGKAILNDPARGTVQITEQELDKAYTGICLEFSPGEAFETGGKPESVLEFIKKSLKGTLKPVLFVMVACLLASFTGILAPVFTRVFTDNILSGENIDWLPAFMLAFAALALLQFVINVISGVYLLKIRGKMAIVSNSKFMWHVLRLPMNFFSQRMAGDLALRQSSNDGIAETLIAQIAPIFINLALLVFYLVVMLRYSVLLTIVGLLTVGVNMGLAQFISKKRINITRAQMRDQGNLSSTTVSAVEMVETIKASGAENGVFEKWAGYHAMVNKSTVEFAKTNQFLGALPVFFQSVSGIAVLALGAWLIMRGQFTAGMLLAFQSFMGSFLNPVNSLIATGQSFQEMRTAMERINDVMQYKPDVSESEDPGLQDVKLEKLKGAVELKNITFGYSRLSDPVIRDFSMTLTPGSKVAFIGSSGCGKSTLAKLISGLYEPWDGEILFDGKKKEEIPRSVFTGSLAVVDQDIIMFEDSVSNNIKMWDGAIEDFEMIMAARDAQIHGDIMLRDGGYSCQVAENGKNFSGGQRQRFEIARVLAQDPTIIILDEATSALDAKTEHEVTKAIKDRGATCIIIAHRLSTIRDCDEIIVMDGGVAVERGSHEELYRAGGLYTKLITTE
ncbi:MAG: NHLP family bacteriocin export ABC transporter peptidase/permease/ATPase subunit [Clostridiales Family XIII bacterium]|jgi:NHLM bacteriocin system ABC transporter peptidase/ATP-binding protein|nr:NHLP family bacteriocin export ABC transporter peptidase/permease/ATPase subunit [Clostridiales Family XIII bacterium]